MGCIVSELIIHSSVTARERVAKKKAVIASAGNLVSSVKPNRYIIPSSSVNFLACNVCQDAITIHAAVLKDCQVAKASVVGGEETATLLGEGKLQIDDNLAGATAFC